MGRRDSVGGRWRAPIDFGRGNGLREIRHKVRPKKTGGMNHTSGRPANDRHSYTVPAGQRRVGLKSYENGRFTAVIRSGQGARG